LLTVLCCGDAENQKRFCLDVAELLDLHQVQCVHVWQDTRHAATQEGFSLAMLTEVRRAYFDERAYTLHLLLTMLRIDQHEDHQYNVPVRDALKHVFKGADGTTLVQTVIGLYRDRHEAGSDRGSGSTDPVPRAIPRVAHISLLKGGPRDNATAELFVQAHLQAWAKQCVYVTGLPGLHTTVVRLSRGRASSRETTA